MAINFPDNPPDGQEYAASNGIVYTYNAANDSWTGALGGNDYWSQDVGGNLYPTDTNADVWVGGDDSDANTVLLSDGGMRTNGTVFAGDATTQGSGLFASSGSATAGAPAITARNYASGGDLFTGYDSGGNINVTIEATGSITVKNYDIDALDFLP